MVTTSDLDADLDLIKSAAVAAGIIASGYFRSDPKTWRKADATPVSEADIAVDDYLHQVLMGERPDYGWLSEEWGEEGRLTQSRVFVVDPIDGTRAFLRGDDAWVISIAVVERGTPLVGVIYAPVRDELYSAALGGGAELNGAPPSVDHEPAEPVISGPTAVHRELQARKLAYTRGESLPSLALRLLQLTTGQFDAVVAKRGAADWDIAAATLVLAECGIAIEDVCDGPPRFDRPTVELAPLVASRDRRLATILRETLKAVYGCPPEGKTEAS